MSMSYSTTKSVRWALNSAKWQPTTAEILLATACIQAEEKLRLARFVYRDDVKSSLIGRLMMRQFIHQSTGEPYEHIEVVRSSNGKPVLAPSVAAVGAKDRNNTTPVNFNVSHQGDYVVLAGHHSPRPIGVDVMRIERANGAQTQTEYFSLMNRVFCDNEWSSIRNSGADEEARYGQYYRLWCLKESYLKAKGVGITVDLRDVSFRTNSVLRLSSGLIDDTEVFEHNSKVSGWTFHEQLLDERHCVAVATAVEHPEMLPFQEVSFEQLMNNATPLLPSDTAYCQQFFDKPNKHF